MPFMALGIEVFTFLAKSFAGGFRSGPGSRVHCPMYMGVSEIRGVPYFGIFLIRLLLFRVLY